MTLIPIIDYVDLCNEDDGWKYVGGECIKLFQDKKNWFDARDSCRSYGGNLFEARDQTKQNELLELSVCRSKTDQAWIGISDTVNVYPPRCQYNTFITI